MLIFNLAAFVLGILPPAGRIDYMPSIICQISSVLLLCFVFLYPVMCFIGSIYSLILILIDKSGCRRKYIILICLFIIELLVWWLGFNMLMSV